MAVSLVATLQISVFLSVQTEIRRKTRQGNSFQRLNEAS